MPAYALVFMFLHQWQIRPAGHKSVFVGEFLTIMARFQ